MHILIISQIFPPDIGGSSTRAYNVAKGLLLNGAKVTVVAGFPHYPNGNVPKNLRKKAFSIEYMDGFKVIRTFVPPIPAKGLANRMILFIAFLISSLFPQLIVRRVNAVFASNPQVLVIIPALVYYFMHRCPVILNVDDLWPEDPVSIGVIRSGFMKKIMKALANIAYTMADVITPISPGYVKVICNNYGVPEGKIHVVRGGVDTSRFKPASNEDNGKFTVLYSGAFSVAYDFNQVIKAAKLLEEHEDIEIVLQGAGELMDNVRRSAEKMDVKNVRIIDKVLSRGEVAELLSQADVLLLPLKDFGRPYLGISSKLYEYQAVGKPIICCAEGQPAEYVNETNSGIVVKPGDYETLAKAVLYLRENRDVAERLGEAGRRYVEENLSIDRIGADMVNLLRALAEAH
ncbi:glycosyltransferase family 4 protein [Candidatus Bathyarchaeota archaeon]|nr:glycosyltransferase family 4 protein [Candidatus Bathyarchaeota archaeon]